MRCAKKVPFPQMHRLPLREYREQVVAGAFSLQGFGADEPCVHRSILQCRECILWGGELALFLEDRGLVIALW